MSTPKRSVVEIRQSIEENRAGLASGVEQLRGEVTRATDWRAHINRHRTPVLIGAAVAGFVIGGGLAALTGRRGRR